MIIDLTVSPDDELSYDEMVAIKNAITQMGHRVEFIDVWNTWDEEQYISKLEKKSPHTARAYRRRKESERDSSSPR